MLHEVLLSLAGGPSPLLTFSRDGDDTPNGLHDLLSLAELALLRSLSQDLGQKHKDIRAKASKSSTSHPSIVCRAVSTAIISTHLASFQRRILEVEKDILDENTNIVGAYNIVPLSAIAGAFDGWGRKLEWLWDLVQFIQDPKAVGKSQEKRTGQDACTAAKVLKHLKDNTYTGYPDIEILSLDLLKVAETAWLRQVSAWVLYGRYPAHGAVDFFITQQTKEGKQSGSTEVYDIREDLIPPFVTKDTAQSILFIGRSLNHIRERQSLFIGASSTTTSPELRLLPAHLAHLSSLEYPLTPSNFSTAVGAIRLSLSQNALQKLLPLSKVVEILHILKDFFLLGRGEFAVALITAADDRLTSRTKSERSKQGLFNDLASLTIKEGEVSAVLARTWNALASLQSLDDEDVDEELDRARELIRLSIKSLDTSSVSSRDPNAKSSMTDFDDLLLPSSTQLSLWVPAPLDLFLSSHEVDTYSYIHSYLLAIRRAHLRLSKLFLLSVLRRDHPSPKARAYPSQLERVDAMTRRRVRSDQRTKAMRPIWATIGSAAYFLAELGEYFQGEVVQGSWMTFYSWLVPPLKEDMRSTDANLMSSIGSSGRSYSSRPTSSRSVHDAAAHHPHDPETLMQAHRLYLDNLTRALLLETPDFTMKLRRFMTSIDHISALMQRLNTIQQGLQSEADNEEVKSSSYYQGEEQRIMSDLKGSRLKVANGVEGLIEVLRSIDAARINGRRHQGPSGTSGSMKYHTFIPWAGDGVDRLLLKFDYGNVDPFAPMLFSNG